MTPSVAKAPYEPTITIGDAAGRLQPYSDVPAKQDKCNLDTSSVRVTRHQVRNAALQTALAHQCIWGWVLGSPLSPSTALRETSPTGGLWAALCGRRSTADSSPPVLRLPKPFIPGSRDICSAINRLRHASLPAQASPTALLLTRAMRCYALRDSLPTTDAVNNDHTRTAAG